MMLFLPFVRPQDSAAKKISVYLLQWVLWILPAGADAFADDVGDTYQGQLRVILSAVIAGMLVVLLFGTKDEVYWGYILLSEVGEYLIGGLVYYAHERSWGM